MSDNKKTTKETNKQEKKKLGKKGILAIVISSVALVGILVGVIVAITISNSSFNYMKKDLSKYISVPEEVYRSFNVLVDIPEVTDEDIQEEIYKLLCAKKIKVDNPNYGLNITISAGDIAEIYFRGYTVENEEKIYFDGGCNFDGDYTELEIGSGSFVPGFESGLIGKNPKNYATFKQRKSGLVESDDFITIQYSVIRDDNTWATKETATIDLGAADVAEKWGEGFKDYFVGKIINPDKMLDDGQLIVPTVCEGATGEDVYYDITILSACKVYDDEKDPLVVEVKFPHDYKDTTLQGKTGYFEVYTLGVYDYEAYEFDDAFITDVLNVSANDISSYQGATLVEKYKSYMREALELQREQEMKLLAEDAFWAQALALSEVKKYPKREVNSTYDDMYSQVLSTFEVYGPESAYANDLDGFARAILGIAADADWKEYLRQDAEAAVKEKLILYYIMQEEGFEFSDEEFDEKYEIIFNDHLQDYLDYYKITETTANYESALAEAKREVLATYGKEYFEELVIYDFVMNEIIKRANYILTV